MVAAAVDVAVAVSCVSKGVEAAAVPGNSCCCVDCAAAVAVADAVPVAVVSLAGTVADGAVAGAVLGMASCDCALTLQSAPCSLQPARPCPPGV